MKKIGIKLCLVFLSVLFALPGSAQATINAVNQKPGKLHKVLKNRDKNFIYSLKVEGVVNPEDLSYITSLPNLRSLDLSGATKQEKTNKKPSVLSGIAGKFIGTNLNYTKQKSSNGFKTVAFKSSTDHYFTKSTSPGAFMEYIHNSRMNRKQLDTLTILRESDLRNPIVAYFDPYFIKIKSSNKLILNKCPKQVQNLDGVTDILNGAFANTSTISSITIPATVSYIPNYCFYGCKSLETVNIQGNVEFIGKYAFAGTSIKSITLPASVKTIWLSSFDGGDIKLLAPTPPEIKTSEGDTYQNQCEKLRKWTVEVPQGAYYSYNGNDMWNKTTLKESGAKGSTS